MVPSTDPTRWSWGLQQTAGFGIMTTIQPRSGATGPRAGPGSPRQRERLAA
jgi:hypothetical protein